MGRVVARQVEINKNGLEQFKIDCSKCSGLCCTALFFSKLDGFPEDKEAGKPCSNLKSNYQCKIHSNLGAKNMKGCIGYDCFGAGQFVTKVIYKGATWRTLQEHSNEIFNVFIIIFQLHQIRYYLEESRTIAAANHLWTKVEELIDENVKISNSSPKEILSFDVENYRSRANLLLKKTIDCVNSSIKNPPKHQSSNYLGKSFKNRNMNGLDLSMNLLLAANFEGCTFADTVFLGADTRDANFSNADLRKAIFLTQGQINTARGNENTKLPAHLDLPESWTKI